MDYSKPYGDPDGELFICPECFHEWSVTTDTSAEENMKSTIKSGTKVKSIRLREEPVNGHDIACKVDGHGQMYLKCSVVKKA